MPGPVAGPAPPPPPHRAPAPAVSSPFPRCYGTTPAGNGGLLASSAFHPADLGGPAVTSRDTAERTGGRWIAHWDPEDRDFWEASGRRIARRNLRSEEHTSELQSRENLVCRLLLEKK